MSAKISLTISQPATWINSDHVQGGALPPRVTEHITITMKMFGRYESDLDELSKPVGYA